MIINKTTRYKWIGNGFLAILSVVLIGVAVSCTDHFDDLNVPGDQITAADVDDARLGKVFATALRHGFSAREGGLSFQLSENLFADEYVQYFTTTEPNFPSAQFVIVGSWNNWMFDHFYEQVATQLTFVEDFTEENNMEVEHAISQVWRVHAYHRMTDFYGPVMYSEVGNAETSVPYDSQEEIYKDFFPRLDDAVEILRNASGTAAYGENDIVYQGDVHKWFLFANSLRLRLAMRISYVEPELARQEAEKAIADGVIENHSDSALMLTTPQSIHGYPAITYIEEFRSTTTMINTLLSYDDPRIETYVEEVEDGEGYKGLRPGLPAVQKGQTMNPIHSAIGDDWRPLEQGGINPDIRVLTATEMYFKRAEGALRGWNMGGTPEELYNEAIRTSLRENRFGNISEEEIEAYINNTNEPIAVEDQWDTPPMTDIPVKYQPDADFETQLEQIKTQEWLAVYPAAFEPWAERRRTGYPVGYAIIESLNSDVARDEQVRRINYTGNERLNNGPALEEAINMLDGPDSPATRLWWDAKPLEDFPTPVD